MVACENPTDQSEPTVDLVRISCRNCVHFLY
jgi:hypothetical protein